MTSSRRLPFVDFARGAAMLAIVGFHAWQHVVTGEAAGYAIRFGGAAVHVFVVLSGFSLMHSWAEGSAIEFYLRRSRRLLWPYFVFVTAMFVAGRWLPLYSRYGVYAYLGHILFYKMFDESIISSFGYHLWFLSTIIQFYLLFPTLRAVFAKLGAGRSLLGAVIVSSGYSWIVLATGHTAERVYNGACLIYLWEFVLGMGLASQPAWRAALHRQARPTTLLAGFLLGGAGALALAVWGGDAGSLFNNPFSLLAMSSALMAGYLASTQRGLALIPQALEWLGCRSYEIYLVHGVIVTRLFDGLQPQRIDARVAVAVLAVVLAVCAGGVYQRAMAPWSRGSACQRSDRRGD